MTITDLLTSVGYQAHRSSGIADAVSDDYLDAKRWVERAIRFMQTVNDWTCHKAEFELNTTDAPALTAGTYLYNMRTRYSDFRKIQGDSLHYGSRGLAWIDEIEEVDRHLGRQWRLSATANGTPSIVTRMGNDLVIGRKPSAEFLTANPGIYGYYYKNEDLDAVTTDLLFDEDFYEPLVDVAMIFALQQQDDAEFRTQLDYWTRQRLPEVRGYDPSPHSDEPIATVDWAENIEGSVY